LEECGVLKKKPLYRKLIGIICAFILILVAAIFISPKVTLAATEPKYHEWDKEQEHVGLSQLWFTDRAANGRIPVRQNWSWGFINYPG
jgi:hypothetical protein